VKFEKKQEGDVWKVAIRGTLTFACVPKLNYELSTLPAGAAVDIDLDVDFIDHAAFESLHSWRLNHEKTGGKVCVEESQEEWYKPAAEGRPRCSREA
jgi:carbonic anhydrase